MLQDITRCYHSSNKILPDATRYYNMLPFMQQDGARPTMPTTPTGHQSRAPFYIYTTAERTTNQPTGQTTRENYVNELKNYQCKFHNLVPKSNGNVTDRQTDK